MPMPRNRTIRLFISSTFEDFTAERDVLQRGVVSPNGDLLVASPFEMMSELCSAAGFAFEAIDLRWGISARASETSATMQRCLAEVRAACASPAPNFISLLGDRYGWRPVPVSLPAEIMAEILRTVDTEGAELIEQWYRIETNTLPATFTLRSELGHPPPDAEQALHQLLCEAWSALYLRPPGTLFASATEQELRVALAHRENGNARQAALVYLREFANMPVSEQAYRYRDVLPDGRPDEAAMRMLHELRHELQSDDRVAVRRYEVAWRNHGPQADENYLSQFARNVATDLRWRIEATIADAKTANEVLEHDTHSAFAAARRRIFVGRKAEQDMVEHYLRSQAKGPFIISGPGGTGKSSLLAWTSGVAAKLGQDVHQRYVGISPEASVGTELLRSLAIEIAGGAVTERPPEKVLTQVLANRGNEPTTFVVDGLDLLSMDDELSTFDWLPELWPSGFHLVMSTRDAGDVTRLKRLFPGTMELYLGPMTLNTALELLDLFLVDAERKVTPRQRKSLLRALRSESRPLFVKLLADSASRWSDVDLGDLEATNLDDVINQIFDELSTDVRHGSVMTAAVMSLLAASRFGLSDGEIHDALSSNETVVTDFQRRHPHSPPIGELPFIAWSAFRADLAPYLATRQLHGAVVFDFFHLDIRRAAIERYLAGAMRATVHGRLAKLFKIRGTDASGAWLPLARRAASEVGHHLLEANNSNIFDSLFTDASFLIAAAGTREFRAGDSEPDPNPCAELIEQLQRRAVLEAEAMDHDTNGQPLQSAKVLQAAIELLAIRPQAVAQLLANRGATVIGDLNSDGVLFTRTDNAPHPLADHGTQITALELSADGQWIAAGDVEGRVSWRPVSSPTPVWCVPAHESWITTISISPKNTLLVSGSDDGGVYLWETTNASRRSYRFPQTLSPIPQVEALTFLDEQTLIVIRMGRTYVVDLDTGHVQRLPGVKSIGGGVDKEQADQFRLVPCRPWVVQCGELSNNRGFLIAGDLLEGTQVLDISLPAGIGSAAIDDSGTVLLSAAYGLRAFDLQRPNDAPRQAASPVFTSLASAGDGVFVGLGRVLKEDKLFYIYSNLEQKIIMEYPIDLTHGKPRLVRANMSSGAAVVGWSSGQISVINTSAHSELSISSSVMRITRGAIGTDGNLALGCITTGTMEEALNLAVTRPAKPPAPLTIRQRDLLVAVAAVNGGGLVSVDRQGHVVAVGSEGSTSTFEIGQQTTAAAEWRGVEGLAVGTADCQAVLVGPKPKHIDFAATRQHGRVPITAIDAFGDEPEVAVALFNGLSAWHRHGQTVWRPINNDHTIRATAIALLSGGRVADGNEIGMVRLWSSDEPEPLMAWNAHIGPVVSIHELPDGLILTTGASGSIVLLDAGGLVVGGAMIEGGIAAARIVLGTQLVAMRRDGWLLQYTITR